MLLKEAYTLVRKKKRNISPNKGFWNQLCSYELDLFGIEETSYSCVDYFTDYIHDFLDGMFERDIVKEKVIEFDCDLTDSLNALFDE